MTTNTSTIVWSATSSALHNAWITAFAAALTAVGCDVTTDTGQLDTTSGTVPYPTTWPTGNVFVAQGYEIRALIHAGLPTIYLKVVYGYFSGSLQTAAQMFPYVTIQTATGTDGAGNLTGTVGVQSYFCTGDSAGTPQGNVTPSGITRPMYMSSDGVDYLTILIDPLFIGGNYPTSSPGAMYIERTVTAATGDYNGLGWVHLNASGYTAGLQTINVSRNLVASTSYPSFQTSGGMWPLSYISDTNLFFPLTVCIPDPQGPAVGLLAYYGAELPGGATFSADIYGVAHTFITAGVHMGRQIDPSNSAFCVAMRYE